MNQLRLNALGTKKASGCKFPALAVASTLYYVRAYYLMHIIVAVLYNSPVK